jgi:hypothetical protein
VPVIGACASCDCQRGSVIVNETVRCPVRFARQINLALSRVPRFSIVRIADDRTSLGDASFESARAEGPRDAARAGDRARASAGASTSLNEPGCGATDVRRQGLSKCPDLNGTPVTRECSALSDLVTGQFTVARLNAILLSWFGAGATLLAAVWPLFAARSCGQGASSRTCHPSGNWSQACSSSAYRRCSRGLALWGGTCVRARQRTRLRSAARHSAVRCRVERPLHGIGSGRPSNDHLGGGELRAGATGHSTRCDRAVAG